MHFLKFGGLWYPHKKGRKSSSKGKAWAHFKASGQSLFLAQVQELSEASGPAAAFGFWLEQERSIPQATEERWEETERPVIKMSWSLPRGTVLVFVDIQENWKIWWKFWKHHQTFPTCIQVPRLLCKRGRVRPCSLYLASFLPEPQKTNFVYESFCFQKGLQSSQEKSLFLQRIFRSAAGFWRPSPVSSPILFVLPCFPGHKQQMVLFTLEIRLCFSQSHGCPLQLLELFE